MHLNAMGIPTKNCIVPNGNFLSNLTVGESTGIIGNIS